MTAREFIDLGLQYGDKVSITIKGAHSHIEFITAGNHCHTIRKDMIVIHEL